MTSILTQTREGKGEVHGFKKKLKFTKQLPISQTLILQIYLGKKKFNMSKWEYFSVTTEYINV